MKIGIITFHFADNYGALLQTLALYQKLTELFATDTIYIVNYCPPNMTKSGMFFRSSLMINNFLLRFIKLFYAILKLPFFLKRKYEFNLIRKRNFKFIDVHNSGCLDIIICGSDQIWNPRITGGLNGNYFGIINGKKIKAISYAASDGGNIEDESVHLIKNFLENVSCISVREKSMAVRLGTIINKKITVSIDPVFLLDSTYWKKLSNKSKYKNYILIYRLESNDQIYKDAYQLAEITGKEIIEIAPEFRLSLKAKHKTLATTGITQFINLFIYADYILTNSFHGTAFSIIFNKQFCTYYVNRGNERIADLLSDLDLSYRQVYSASDVIKKSVNYDYVNIIIEQKRKEADIYFKNITTPPPPPLYVKHKGFITQYLKAGLCARQRNAA